MQRHPLLRGARLQRGAVIGLALDNWMLTPDWVRGESDPKIVQLKHMVDHVDKVCQLAGNARHVAIGTDLDGATMPDPLADVSRLPVLFDALRAAGFDEPDLEKVAWGNWRRVL